MEPAPRVLEAIEILPHAQAAPSQRGATRRGSLPPECSLNGPTWRHWLVASDFRHAGLVLSVPGEGIISARTSHIQFYNHSGTHFIYLFHLTRNTGGP
jgi:hypothetical protein